MGSRNGLRSWAAVIVSSTVITCASEHGFPNTDGGNADVQGPNGCFAGPTAPMTTGPASRDPGLLARAATVVGSCIEDDGIERNLGHMWNEDLGPDVTYLRTVRQASCLANARCGCRAVQACLGFSLSLGDAGSCEACSGTVAKICGSGYWGTIDCGRLGLICDPVAVCAPSPAASCDMTTFVATCDAIGRPQVCRNQGNGGAVFTGPDCAKLGLACAAGRCAGTGVTGMCSAPIGQASGGIAIEGAACIGTDLDACVAGRHATIRCADRGPGFACQSFGGRFFCGLASECVPPSEGPALLEPVGQCEGNTVVICNAGRIDKIDCTTLGFTGCEFDKSQGKYGCIPGPR